MASNNKDESRILIFVSGDFCPAAVSVDVLMKGTAAKTIFGDIYETIRDADFSITNLECPLTVSNGRIKKIGPNLKATSGIASLLKGAGFNMVTLANNHIFDYGQQGLVDTLNALQQNGLLYVGAGLTPQEARKTMHLEIKDIKLAIINFAEVEYSCADQEHGGANPMNLIDNFNQIQAARRQADYVLVIVHGGHEHYHYPSPATLKRYRFYAEAGASVVIAHHTHCIGGYEWHKGVPIFYSLGNFFFPSRYKLSTSWYEGYAVLLTLSNESLDFKIVPYEQCKGRSLAIERSQSKESLRKIEDINRALGDDAQIAMRWEEFVKERYQYYLTQISGFGRFKATILRRIGLLDSFYRRTQLENVRHLLRCEAHKEAALEILSKYLEQ